MSHSDLLALAMCVAVALLLLGVFWLVLEVRDRRHARMCAQRFDAMCASMNIPFVVSGDQE